ncbi:type VI secretion system-associated FHA domain protein TagH [Roseomonas sp. 18066]|uniref:type VI secretion system-associated FHA domain protein TagH n=1 Tax=Roseomonas sp. 18066 TaxID=2681412 RepID=UPI00135B847A|nr:type VI secretion system-associated FHA domain protein TagH [Roseomonas sp. 18066]
MELSLSVLRCPDSAVPETRQARGDFCIGRAPGNDWVLADPDRVLSKKHCVLEFRAGGWQIRDLSTNGCFLNGAATPVGRDRTAPLADGDRLRLGAWEIELRVGAGAGASSPGNAWGGGDPFAAAPSSPEPPLPYGGPPPGAALDPLFDPMAAAPPPRRPFGETAPEAPDPFGEGEAPMPDHRPSAHDAFTPPPTRSASLIPDDWDLEMPAAAPPPVAPAPVPVAPVAPPPVAPPPAPPPVAGGEAAALAAFLDGAGLPPHALTGADAAAALRAAGAVTRAAVAGIRALLIARADIKREFRIEQTMLRAAGNNPVKFAASDLAALQALLSNPEAGALEETVADLAAHQAATLAATQAAARALLSRLSPAPLEAGDSGGGILPGSKEKRLWEAYKALHRQTVAQFDDDFDSAFGKAFARAYEDAAPGRAARGGRE